MKIEVIIMIVLPLIWIAFEVGLVIRDRARGMGTVNADKGSRNFNFLALIIGLTTAGVLNGISIFFFPGGRKMTVFVIGTILMLLGMALRFWAIATLGKSFRTTVETDAGQKVIKSGPYKLIRHPSYSGWLLVCLGFGIALQNWLSLAFAFILPLSAFLYRIRVEEPALVKAFGEEYMQYQMHSKRLIPWVW